MSDRPVPEAPAAEPPGVALTARLSALAAGLRARGGRVGVGEVIGGHRALAAVDPASRRQAFFALRAALCSRHDDLARFAEAFEEVFGAGTAAAPGALPPAAREVLPQAAAPGEGRRRPREEGEPVPAAWSAVELLRAKDFGELTEDEEHQARAVLRRLAVRGPRRRSRRLRPTRHRGRRPDLRATVRSSLRHGGEPVNRRWREPGLRQRPLVLVLDVSGSMQPYARMLLAYVQAAVAARRRVEAFALGTRLTRVTRELAGRDVEGALRRATAAVTDYAGGTRIGEGLATLNREHGRRVGRGAVVVLLSDGWDRGDPEQLAAEAARLARTAHRLIWLNPLKAAAGYEPLTRGMRAALPHADHFLAGHSLASLEQLAAVMERDPPRRAP